MHKYTELIVQDLKLSLGVTEPGSIAMAVSKARSLAGGMLESISLELNSGIYKNAFTCGIPGTEETGIQFAAALGAVAGDWRQGLAALDGITDADVENAKKLIRGGIITVLLREISSELYIRAVVRSSQAEVGVTIEGTHDHISRVERNGTVVECSPAPKPSDQTAPITRLTLADFWAYTRTVPAAELAAIKQAYDINLALAQAGAASPHTDLCKSMIADNTGALFSQDERKTAQALTAAAIEARVRGMALPAMSITGSGNHGIISTMPLYASATIRGCSAEQLYRATALTYLVTMFIKEYSGKLSAFCGCAIAAGTGTAVGLLFLLGGSLEQAKLVINNMASSLTGMICTGGNPACVLKASIAVDMGYRSVDLALRGVAVSSQHGILGCTPDDTMRFMGYIASPGMEQTERAIIDILHAKERSS